MKIITICLLLLFISGCAYMGYLRDPFTEIPNFYRVDERLYRGGQPKPEGYKKLQALGIKTVISLRGENENTGNEKETLTTLGINFYNLPMSVYSRPKDEQVLLFLETVLNKNNQPVFLHCESGRDRTGAIVAMYKVVVSGSTIKQAYKEAKNMGFWPYRGEAELKNFIHQLKDKQIYFEKAQELNKWDVSFKN